MSAKDKTPALLKIVRWLYPKVETIWPSLAHRYFVTLFFTPLHFKVPAKEQTAETYAEKFSLQINNKKVQCYSWGKTDKVVLVVHGWGGRATQFRRFTRPLNQAGYRVVGFDAPAHGKSEGSQTSILEFEQVIRKLYDTIGIPDAVIAHSFGGGAVLFAAANGLPVKSLVNIASPTMGSEIISTYLRTIHAAAATGEYFRAYILKRFGKSFDDFTAMQLVRHLPQTTNLLLIHDEDDKDVPIYQAEELIKIYTPARLFKTKGLGHTRILKDDVVINKAVTYINNPASHKN